METQLKVDESNLDQDTSFMAHPHILNSLNFNGEQSDDKTEAADQTTSAGIEENLSNNQLGEDFNYSNTDFKQHPDTSVNCPAEHNGEYHYVSCEPAPMAEIKLFCGRVPKTMSEDDIKQLFKEYGIVKEVIIIRDKESNNHKSSAFVRMASIAHADAAIQALNGQKTLDQAMGPLQVKYANGEAAKHNLVDTTATEPGSHQAKTFVGSLPKSVTEDMIRELFSPYGVVDEVFIMTDKASGVGKGCAFVKFAFKEQALFAMKSLDGKRTLEGCSRPIEVRFAETKSQKVPATFNPYPVPYMGNPYSNMVPTQLPIIHSAVPPLPSNANLPRSMGPWKEYWSPEGRPYYHNEQTQATTWEKPMDFDQIMNNSSLVSGSFGPKGANIFIFYVPNEWTQNDLITAFSSYGNIISARIATDKQSGRNRGYAFVSYDSAQAAASAVHHMNGYLAMAKKLKVTIKKGEESYVQPLLDQLAGSSPGGGGSEQMRNQQVFAIGGQSTHFPGKYPISLYE